jgi:hypothetical protein
MSLPAAEAQTRQARKICGGVLNQTLRIKKVPLKPYQIQDFPEIKIVGGWTDVLTSFKLWVAGSRPEEEYFTSKSKKEREREREINNYQ